MNQLILGGSRPVCNAGRVADALFETVGPKGAEGDGASAVDGTQSEEERGHCGGSCWTLKR